MAMYLGDKPVKVVLSLLPDKYQEVEYIESTGTQYINTGVIPSGNKSRYIVDYVIPNGAVGLSLFGNSVSTPYDITVYHRTNTEALFFAGNSSDIFSFSTPIGQRYVIDVEAGNGCITANLSDGQTKTANYTGELNNTKSVYIFGANNGERGLGYRLYSFKAYDNDTLVRDYIPCYRKADNEIGLYDLVNKEFYTNKGSGTFLKGENKTTVRYFTAPIKKCTGNNLFDVSKLINTTVDGDYFIGAGAGKSFYNLRVTPLRTYTVTYTVKTGNDGVGAQLLMAVVTGKDNGYYGNGKRIAIILKARGGEYSVTNKFTVPENVNWVSFSTISHLFRTDNFTINEGYTALPYEPYKEWYEY